MYKWLKTRFATGNWESGLDEMDDMLKHFGHFHLVAKTLFYLLFSAQKISSYFMTLYCHNLRKAV